MANAAKLLRSKNADELQEELISLRREYFNLCMQKAAQQNNKTSEIKRVRRGIARVLTLIGEHRRSN
ncbi:MAG: 50S ribosomal protein L29 [Proteobacteria bacterium]|nr:50S ribosomal protein L29 [Pseudomonadota bacterium]MCH9757768.1 50S ribosomal protein L29 [Pseudomonadota bacterium]